jgi:hypothetical protein
MIDIKDVKYWLVNSDKIGHVVFGVQNGITQLGCCIILADSKKEDFETEMPKRICKKCRESLKTATKAK